MRTLDLVLSEVASATSYSYLYQGCIELPQVDTHTFSIAAAQVGVTVLGLTPVAMQWEST